MSKPHVQKTVRKQPSTRTAKSSRLQDFQLEQKRMRTLELIRAVERYLWQTVRCMVWVAETHPLKRRRIDAEGASRAGDAAERLRMGAAAASPLAPRSAAGGPASLRPGAGGRRHAHAVEGGGPGRPAGRGPLPRLFASGFSGKRAVISLSRLFCQADPPVSSTLRDR